MFEKLGIVTNCLAKRLAGSDTFEKLIHDFIQNGFFHIEIRDGDYLRESAFGEILQEIETAMGQYSDSEWQHLCRAVHNHTWQDIPWIRIRDRQSLHRFGLLLQKNPEAVFSYAIAHPWTSRPENQANDQAVIIRAKKLACLFTPANARLRLVDIDAREPLDESAAVSNLLRYQSLALECPVALAVENAVFPPRVILDLASKGRVHLAYDEANIFSPGGTAPEGMETFWKNVGSDQLISVHLKQKTNQGVRARLGEGFVDLPVLVKRLSNRSYRGDWLLEYRATDHPVQDAIQSREYLLTL